MPYPNGRVPDRAEKKTRTHPNQNTHIHNGSNQMKQLEPKPTPSGSMVE